ncbi:MAG: ureidoglycolate lyase [Proteobacteria bacterium]|nr:ureidoglycolate lyase [Pseudomonadota bacterium]MDA1058299.1 ureidoglycolate lyase [Pseudomonadota bacterium]
MSISVRNVTSEPLNADQFAPFGDVLAPRETRLDNRDLLAMGYARMSDDVADSRLDDFDVLDYWGGIANISQEPMRLGYLRPKKRDLAFSWFERHLKGTQTFVPLKGARSVIAVAPPYESNNPEALPKLDEVRAFVLDGSMGINLHPGTWHWTPFPLDDQSDFIILVRESVAEDDLNFIDLEKRLNARVQILLADQS